MIATDYPWLGVQAYETYIADSEFLFPNLRFSAPTENIRDTQRRHMYLHAIVTSADAEPAPSSEDEVEPVQCSKPKDSDDAADMTLSVEDCDARTIEHHIVIDSGTSAHMTGTADHLYAKTPCSRKVIVTNGGVTTATLMGKINISTQTPSTLTLTDVLLIKGMTTSLLSVPALVRANPKIRVELQRDACTILLGSKTVACANNQRLYILEGVFTYESANSAATVADKLPFWHHRIGHSPVEALRTCDKAGLGLPDHAWTAPAPRCTESPLHAQNKNLQAR
ncbi:hypothetical protein DYB32_007804 [Aphanomyces invadans]|uniref:Retrovirus-related Pol polyprotein from transposon TNT 1-94-like beta-barrel domain-containing protein n=1 Tax=Aphanomyces invadans TaxID=157072 RepID=A0A3R6YUS0_9STRA|nr:hypothetical protein DYB32_007804 [Aphanomyces invadans]